MLRRLGRLSFLRSSGRSGRSGRGLEVAAATDVVPSATPAAEGDSAASSDTNSTPHTNGHMVARLKRRLIGAPTDEDVAQAAAAVRYHLPHGAAAVEAGRRKVASLDSMFVPLERDVPRVATAASHQLLLRSGMVALSSSGLYHLLPLGVRVLRKLKLLVRSHMTAVGAQECVLATLTRKELWQSSGRWAEAGPELMRVTDRKGSEYCLAPTHEEAITALVGSHNLSYRALPQLLYQMERKFRDEMRPRYGLIRAREFWMKDLYTFDVDEAAAHTTYANITAAYAAILNTLNLPFSCVQADPTAMGGVSSHEFHVHATIGEDELVYCDTCERAANTEALAQFYKECPLCAEGGQGAQQEPSAAAQETQLNATAAGAAAADASPTPEVAEAAHLAGAPRPVPPTSQCHVRQNKGIEVGHAFILGEKYSSTFGATYTDKTGTRQNTFMGCYGLGLTRLIAATVEALHDEHGMQWPLAIAPYSVGIVTVTANAAVDDAAEALAARLEVLGLHDDVIIDRRDLNLKAKLADARLLGLPYVVIIGSRYDASKIEVHERATGRTFNCSASELAELLETSPCFG